MNVGRRPRGQRRSDIDQRGDGTAMYISQQLAGLPVEITRLARGITSGSVLEFANKEILADALSGRQKF